MGTHVTTAANRTADEAGIAPVGSDTPFGFAQGRLSDAFDFSFIDYGWGES
jgi:hypothetical protein